MNAIAAPRIVSTLAELEKLYGVSGETSTVKVASRLTPQYRRLIEASRFLILATAGPEGLDCSPRGDEGSVARIQDETTLLIPDRRGNDRIDSLRNIVRDPRVGLLYLLPGIGWTLRVNGRAGISADADLTASFSVDGKAPRSVVIVSIDEVYFQCARAIVRSELWNPERHVDASEVPTPGEILASMSDCRVGGAEYDEAWPERARKSLW